MFDELLKTVSVDIATVRAIIQTNEQLRIIIFSSDSATKVELLENPEFNSLLNAGGVTTRLKPIVSKD